MISFEMKSVILSWLSVVILFQYAHRGCNACDTSCWEEIIANSNQDPEINMNTSEIIARWGYVPESYEVTTEDGYILTMFRILPKTKDHTGPRPVIFLQHGAEAASTSWVTNLPNQSAGFFFSDKGFDVWLGNTRGNRYGNRHITLNTESSQFWNFSWPEMAEYDLPAMIDKILTVTGQKKVYYVGHSQGTLIFFAKSSTDQQFSSKIHKMYALGPVYTLKHTTGMYKFVAKIMQRFPALKIFFGKRQFTLDNSFLLAVMKSFCSVHLARQLCSKILFSSGSTDTHYLNATRLPVMLAHYPAGASAKNFEHLMQMMNSGRCQNFDYGTPEKNQLHYGQDTPPLYNVSSISVPVSVFYSTVDKMTAAEDVENSLLRDLKITGKIYLFNDVNHADYTWGMNAVGCIYIPIANDILNSGHVEPAA